MITKESIDKALQHTASITAERKAKLAQIADYIQLKRDKGEIAHLNFICTHNSRRSHLAQILSAVAAWHYKIPVQTWSGGSEVTAFNPRAIAALKRMGIKVSDETGENPHFKVTFAIDGPTIECFSKTFDDPYNPQNGFAAIMVCSSADANCPFVGGAEKRISITYEDPGNSDGTPNESDVYDLRALEILSEQLYAFSLIQN